MDPTEERHLALQRLHDLDAMAAAVDRRAELLALVADSGSADEARVRLQTEWGFTAEQALAALDLQVRRFSARDRGRIAEEREWLVQRLSDLSR